MRDKLLHAVIEWDRKQSTKKFYNPHGLGIMFKMVDMVSADIEAGADPRKAIIAGFNGRLLDHVLRSVGLPTASKEEHQSGSLTYQPLTK